MITIVIGGSGSGKSEIAEEIAASSGNSRRIYIATMQPYDEESRKRIEKHRLMRRDKNFETIECYRDLEKAAIPEDAAVLLECMSNLAANEMFTDANTGRNPVEAVKSGILSLMEKSENLVIVTNNVFDEGTDGYDDTTDGYLKVLGEMNRWICSLADLVIEAVHGIPVEVSA